jgi:hypothetical protein
VAWQEKALMNGGVTRALQSRLDDPGKPKDDDLYSINDLLNPLAGVM